MLLKNWLSLLCVFLLAAAALHATCPGCTQIGSPEVWGIATTSSGLNEASGLAVSTQNPGVIWTHNDDGDDGRIFAYSTNGVYLARFYHNRTLSDVEDMALGPGPLAGVSYLYLGDIGGGSGVRSSVTVLRIPEPGVSLSWSSSPHNTAIFANVESFTLEYPDGSFDAETLMLDPVSGDLFIGTKQNSGTRIYRANVNGATNGSTLMMQFVVSVPFASASGGAISSNGRRIALRRENSAEMWIRCDGETVGSALTRGGFNIPVIGPPTEPNGEGIAFLPDGSGYLTISDRTSGTSYEPPIYFFPAQCSLNTLGTEITQPPQSLQVEPGTDVQFSVTASGEDLRYQWRFQGADIPNAILPVFAFTNVQPANAGAYSVLVSGAGGFVLSDPAFLTVKMFPPTIVAQPASLLAATGSTVQLSVGVQGTAPFSYAWTHGSKQIVATTPALMLTDVQKANAGKYRVTVSNNVGRVTSAYASLKVLNPPVIITQPQSVTNVVGSKVKFRARAKGSPRLRYQWLFNGAPITNALKSSLTLKNVQPAESGQYSVTVSNAVGIATSITADLTIQ